MAGRSGRMKATVPCGLASTVVAIALNVPVVNMLIFSEAVRLYPYSTIVKSNLQQKNHFSEKKFLVASAGTGEQQPEAHQSVYPTGLTPVRFSFPISEATKVPMYNLTLPKPHISLFYAFAI